LPRHPWFWQFWLLLQYPEFVLLLQHGGALIPVLLLMHGGTWLFTVAAGFWAFTFWAKATPTKAATISIDATASRIAKVFFILFFTSTISIGLRVV
jgi:hypothetical protein